MSSICIVPLQWDYKIKGIKVHTFKPNHDSIDKKETYNVEKSDSTAIEMFLNTISKSTICYYWKSLAWKWYP